MSAVNLTNVTILDYLASFLAPFQFEISYEYLTLPEDGTLSLSPSLSQLLLLLCLKNQARWPQEEDNEYHRVWGYHWSLEIWAMLGFDLGDRDREEKEMARFNFSLWK